MDYGDDNTLITDSGISLSLECEFTDFTDLEIDNTFQLEIIISKNFPIELNINDNLEENLIVKYNRKILKVTLRENVSYRDIIIEVMRNELKVLGKKSD